MNLDDPRLRALAEAVSDGGPIDWDREVSDPSAAELHGIVQSLRLVAKIAQVHREGSEPHAPDASAFDRTENLPHAPATATQVVDRGRAPSSQTPSLPGFRLARKLGEGGMGIVYEAEQLHPHRPVALKVIRAGLHADPVTLRMFEREMQTLARMKHPGIAAIHESGTTPEGLPFYTMELVRGETLDEHLARRKNEAAGAGGDLAYRLALFRKICEAVAYAHQRGIIHRDLKPGNILVLREPPSGPPSFGPAVPDIKILDFGLAKIADPDVSGTLVSEVGRVKGTLAYMSPEQVRGNPDEIDMRTDVYSLGVILYEMIAGSLPYELSRAALPEAVRVISEEPPRPLTKTLGGSRRIDADVLTIVGKALEKEPARRYSTAQALAEDVQRYLTDQPIQARRPSAAYQLRKLVARHQLAFAFAATLFVVLTASTIGLAFQAARIAHERDRANQEAGTAGRVTEFLVSLFRVSDPGESRGNTITAREILDTGSVRVSRELQDQPVVRARMLDTIGNVYRSLGLYTKAEPLLQEGLRVRQETQGARSLDAALSHNSLAHSLIMHGGDAEGERHAREALGILQAAGREDSVDGAWSLYFLALSRTNQADYAGAKESFERARSLFEKHAGRESLPVAWCLGELGRSLALGGDIRAALGPSEEALRIKERLLGPKHPDVSLGLNNVGYLRMHLGDLPAARTLLERALAIGEGSYGPEHRFTGNILESLGELHFQMGDPAGARPLLERAVAIFDKQLEPDSYDNAIAKVSLARVLLAQGELERAGALFESALASHERTGCLGAEAATLFTSYADYLRRTGKSVEAARFDERARAASSPR